MLLDETTIKDIKKSCGYGYGWNFRKVPEFTAIFGFSPVKYPQYFKVTDSGYVEKTELFIKHSNAVLNNSKNLMNMLTERS